MTRVYLSEAEKRQQDASFQAQRDAAFTNLSEHYSRARRQAAWFLLGIITACVVGGFLLGLAFALQFPHLIPLT